MPTTKITKSRAGRRQAIIRLVREAGIAGLTRDQISVRLDLPVHCICADALQAIKAGQLVYQRGPRRGGPLTRRTRLGSPARVLCAPEHQRPRKPTP